RSSIPLWPRRLPEGRRSPLGHCSRVSEVSMSGASIHFIDTRAELSTSPRGFKPIVIMKFGSSVLAGPGDIPNVVSQIYRSVRHGKRVVAVVSAFASVTDRLLEEATKAGARHDNVNAPAYVALGEETSAALLALACDRSGLCAIALKSCEVG